MKTTHDIATNLRLLSVQVGIAGGAATAALAAFDSCIKPLHIALTVPPVLYAISGGMTAIGVFAARMWPQPSVTGSTPPASIPTDGGA